MKLVYAGITIVKPLGLKEFSLDLIPMIRIDNDVGTIRLALSFLFWGIELYWNKKE